MSTEREKMLAELAYDPSDPELVAQRRDARLAAEAFNRTSVDELELRSEMLKEFASPITISDNVVIGCVPARVIRTAG